MIDTKISSLDLALLQLEFWNRKSLAVSLYSAFVLLFVCISAFLSIKLMLRKNNSAVYGYLLFYIIIHGAKGSWGGMLHMPFLYFFIFLALRNLYHPTKFK